MPDTDAATRLRTFLGAEPPAGVLDLGDAQQAALADLLEDARVRQARSLEEAFTASLKHVPFPVRGIVKKVLMG
ncbi:hypothetical protein [Jatrophihabitans fulvus]